VEFASVKEIDPLLPNVGYYFHILCEELKFSIFLNLMVEGL
jgi:hypothetical protein